MEIFIVGKNSKVLALDGSNGNKLWEFPRCNILEGEQQTLDLQSADDGTIYVSNS